MKHIAIKITSSDVNDNAEMVIFKDMLPYTYWKRIGNIIVQDVFNFFIKEYKGSNVVLTRFYWLYIFFLSICLSELVIGWNTRWKHEEYRKLSIYAVLATSSQPLLLKNVFVSNDDSTYLWFVLNNMIQYSNMIHKILLPLP